MHDEVTGVEYWHVACPDAVNSFIICVWGSQRKAGYGSLEAKEVAHRLSIRLQEWNQERAKQETLHHDPRVFRTLLKIPAHPAHLGT